MCWYCLAQSDFLGYPWQNGLHRTKVTSHDGHQSQREDLPPKTERAGHDHLEGDEREGTDSGIQGDHSEEDGD